MLLSNMKNVIIRFFFFKEFQPLLEDYRALEEVSQVSLTRFVSEGISNSHPSCTKMLRHSGKITHSSGGGSRSTFGSYGSGGNRFGSGIGGGGFGMGGSGGSGGNAWVNIVKSVQLEDIFLLYQF